MSARAARPRLLFVSPRFLFPMDQGGKIRTGNILRAMKGGAFEVTLASPAPADIGRFAADLDAACDHFVSWPERPPSKIGRALSLASAIPVAVAGDRSAEGSASVARALADKPDVVVVDFPHAGVLVPERIDAASVMFTHNVEAEIFERHAARTNGLWRLVWADQSRKMNRFEQDTLRRFDAVIAVSKRDAEVLTKRYALPVVAEIDTGVDLDFFAPAPPQAAPDPGADGGTLVFTATMSWAANVEGIHFLLDEVWPTLLAARPKIGAVIIGRNPPAALADKIRQRGLNVTLTGFVEDIRPYVARSHVYVIPLFVGSGTRIKAFEAMAMGRPVVSTSLGIEGLDVTDGENFLRADNAQEFSRAILSLLDDAAMRHRIAGAARRLTEERFSWRTVAAQFEAICQRALERR
ncbi:MAG: glycosyltransferase [Acetobacteraceae bacterium]|nr:glycosyltransferase [Acetobacteraceae bacterium]